MKPVLKEAISLWQLFVIIILSNTGSSLILVIAPQAKNDAWLAILLASFGGVLILFLTFYLVFLYPQKDLFAMLQQGFGKPIGKLIITIYIVYFFLNGAIVLRDFGELMVATIFTETPIEIVLLTMIYTCGYILFLGIEVLGRSTEIFIPYFISVLFFIGVGLLFATELKFSQLEPFLGEGLKPIFSAIFPYHITFPFGEFIPFLVIVPFMQNPKKVRKWGIWAVLASGTILCYITIIQIMTLGGLRERANFPLMATASEISLLNFIERIDLLVVFIVMLGILIKTSIYYYAGLKGLEHLFSIPYRSFIFPLAPIIGFISIVIGKNYTEYKEFDKILPYIQIPFQFLFPSLLLIIGVIIQRKRGEKKNEHF